MIFCENSLFSFLFFFSLAVCRFIWKINGKKKYYNNKWSQKKNFVGNGTKATTEPLCNTLILNLLEWKKGAYLHFKDVFSTLRLRSNFVF